MRKQFLFLLMLSGLLFCTLGRAQINPHTLQKLQSTNLDSANALIKKAIESTEQQDSVQYLEYLLLRGNLLKGHLPREEAIDSLLEFELKPKLKLNLLNLKGSIFYYTGRTDEALELYGKQYRQSLQANYDETARKALSNLSAIYSSRSIADSALHYAMLSIEADKAAKDTTGFSYAYNYIGLAYQEMQLYEKSIEFLKKGLLYKPTPITHANLLYNIGVAFNQLIQTDSSVKYTKEAEARFTALGYNSGLVKTNNVMGSNMVNESEYDKAEEYYLKSLELATALSDKRGVIVAEHSLGKMNFLKGEFKKAIDYGKSSFTYCHKNELYDFAKNSARNVALSYAGLSITDSAIHYASIADTLANYLNSKQYLDKLSDAESKLNLAEAELDLANKEKTIANLLNRQLRFLIIGVSVVALLIIVFLFIRAQQRKKHHQAIMAEKQESLNKEILAAENERSRISKELHDGIGQQISALSMNLQFLKRSKNDDQLKEGLNTISQQLKQSAEDVRDISHQMMPRVLVENGLVDAIDLLLKQSFRNSEVQHEFEVDPSKLNLDKKIEISLYRILQELINNIVKHSQANQVHVRLSQTANSVVMKVRDNGVGFSTSKSAGHGMHNIQSRIDMFKGKFIIENMNGTFASITIPLA
ncbi:MAG: sensor histidine kinase [Bacteroidetes bacterium]|nr:sensor histidine kinase [Bacteroidota bacterium]